MKKIIFVAVFLLSCALCVVNWMQFTVIDLDMWANQARYVQIGDPAQFDARQAYGHPGGPIIEGTVLIHSITGEDYVTSLRILLIVLNSIVVGLISVLCFTLRKDILWCIAILGILPLSRLFDYLTPPSAVASLLAVLLAVITLIIYRNRHATSDKYLLAWSIVAGALMSTRIDIGILASALFTIFMIGQMDWRRILYMLACTMPVFWFLDPFMWFMPVQHLRDLIEKIIFHYAEFTPSPLSAVSVLTISCLATLSFVLATCLVFINRKKCSEFFIPGRYFAALVCLTGILYAVVLTSHYQAQRYFVPVLFIWEFFLPVFMFDLISDIRFNFVSLEKNTTMQTYMRIAVVALLIGFNGILLINALI